MPLVFKLIPVFCTLEAGRLEGYGTNVPTCNSVLFKYASKMPNDVWNKL